MVIPRSPPMAPDRPRILVIEDDLLIALMIEDMVREAGYRVSGVAHTIAVARHEIAKRNFDAVLFDLDIGRRSHPEIADFLLDTGVPFAFVTGYDYLVEPRHQTVPVLEKPFTPVQLRALLESTRVPYFVWGHARKAVCTENLNANVVMVKSAQDRVRIDRSDPLNVAIDRRVFAQ